MNRHQDQSRSCHWLGALCLTVFSLLQQPVSSRATEPDDWFESRIRPVLAETCFRCHGDQKTAGDLRVDSRDTLIEGGNSGPAINLDMPSRSLLLQAIRREADVAAMPPDAKGALRPEQVADFERWIEMGAPWPQQAPRFATSRHWAYEQLRETELPTVNDQAWPRTTIDVFIRHAQEAVGLQPAPQADRLTLIRRASFDLTGLPPTPEEVTRFLADESPDAFERLVDRLLATPRYGERWGRFWLDVVRYADSAGETADYPVPSAWRFRNYVIASLNADLPYDQFVREQIAGDILGQRAPGVRYADQVTATGYLAMSRRFGFDSENYHHLTIHDTIDNLGQAFLGLSLGCARCHDHKFDAVSIRDYYALYGIFDSTRYPFPGSEQKQRVRTLSALVPPGEAVARWREYEQQITRLTNSLSRRGTPQPNAVLRWLGDIDGDFELQAPAAGGSYGVLVPPWMYRGKVSVTTAAQSPYRNVCGAARVGASVAAAAGVYNVTQSIPDWLTGGGSIPVYFNFDFRLGAPTPGQTARHRFAITDAAGTPVVDLRVGSDGAWLRIQESDVRVGDVPAGQWLSLQARLDPVRGEVTAQLGIPGRMFSSGPHPVSPSWNGRAELVVIEGIDDTPAPAWDFDNFAVRTDPLPPVSTEVPQPSAIDPEQDPSHLTAELRRLAGIDGDLELQPNGGSPTSPWNPGPNSVVRLSNEGQSPFTNIYSRGEQGFVLPNRAEYDGFGVTLPPIPANDEGQLHLAFDFRLGIQAAGGDGSWRYYLGQGPGASAALELFFNGREFYRRSADEKMVVASLQGETWYQVRVVLDVRQKTYRGELCREGEIIRFDGHLATGWDGQITYSFIDSYGHLPGVRPALAVDNFILQGQPLPGFETQVEPTDSPSVSERKQQIARLRNRLRELEKSSEQDRQELERLLIEGPFPMAYAMSEGTPHDVKIQLRGEPTNPGNDTPRGFVSVMGNSSLPAGTQGSGRLELAQWLTRSENPLLARVIVNRVWQQHFGRGLVKTPNDFGVRGQPPSNPALLDHLALQLQQEGWSLKALHRLILTSAAWQQQVVPPTGAEATDQFAGFTRRRLSAEEIRDAILVVAGELDPSVGEAHPFPAPTAFGFSQHGPFSAVYEHNRRSIYLMTQRLKRHPFLSLFDGADPNASTAERAPTTVPTQALFFLNDRFLHEATDHWASRLTAMDPNPTQQLEQAWHSALGRMPTSVELQEALDFLQEYRSELEQLHQPRADQQALAACLRLLLGCNEFLYLD